MEQLAKRFDKSRDSFLSSFLLLVSIGACFSGSPKVFTSVYNVASYELSFITLFLLFKLGQPASLPAKPGMIPLTFLSLWFLIIVYHTLSLWLNAAPFYEVALLKAGAITIHALFLYCLSSFLLYSRYAYKAICYALIGSSSYIAATYYVYALYIKVDTQFFLEGALFAANIRHVGFIASLASLVAVAEIYCSRRLITHLLLTLVLSFNLSFVIWLGSRGGVLATLLTAILILLLYNHRQRLSLRMIFSTMAATALAFVISLQFSVYSWNGPGRIVAKLPLFSHYQSGTVTEDMDLSSGRLELWRNTFERGQDSLWFGHGPENFFIVSPDTGKIDSFLHPHNSLLQIFFDTGIFGLISATIVLLTLIRYLNFIRKRCPDEKFPEIICGLSLVVFLMLLSLTSGTLYFPQTLFFFVCAIAFTANQSETSRKFDSTSTANATEPDSNQHLSNQVHSARTSES